MFYNNIDFDTEIEKQRLKNDLQEAKIFCSCDKCLQEIYYGNAYYIDSNTKAILCENCFDEIQLLQKVESERIAGEEDE